MMDKPQKLQKRSKGLPPGLLATNNSLVWNVSRLLSLTHKGCGS